MGPWKLRLANLKQFRDWPELDRGSQQLELYHLENDLGEKHNLASERPDVVERLLEFSQSIDAS
jgi:hypothetical protein